ncbi:acyl-CoA dehydrogenase family protein [Pseudonocardia sp. NPDC049154]|uniref:acyl-CoA dehydrogenase family protein n=1 Tax=Pseudonocardia sp. NPDC049154 TaxID=3155501 RepID=UPI0033F3B360
MDYVPSPDQKATLEVVESLLGRQAGPARARELRDRHDDTLLAALEQAGFLDLALDPNAGPLDAALVTEAAARALAAVHVGARALVAPQVLDGPVPPRIALADAANPGPIRFGTDADVVLVLDGPDVRVVEPAEAERVETGYVLPYARVDLSGGRVLPGAGPRMAAWWRVALAAEVAGLLDAALSLTSEYLAQRTQFNRPLGSLQALQHRLAEAYVWVEGVRWSARSAAWHGDAESAATAATYATMAAREVAVDMHQLSGAIGFTEEYDLHLWTMRAQALRTELGGIGGHAGAVTALRWAG